MVRRVRRAKREWRRCGCIRVGEEELEWEEEEDELEREWEWKWKGVEDALRVGRECVRF